MIARATVIAEALSVLAFFLIILPALWISTP